MNAYIYALRAGLDGLTLMAAIGGAPERSSYSYAKASGVQIEPPITTDTSAVNTDFSGEGFAGACNRRYLQLWSGAA
jgi:hypothetical protein